MEHRQYTCDYDGCGKSFARKEHLARHAKSHNPANMLQCPVCRRHFNRNDSLQRHIVKHGAGFKQNPSGRSKQACDACRAGKTKCDGNDNCAKCIKRGIECRYGQEDPGQQRDESPNRNQRLITSPVAEEPNPIAQPPATKTQQPTRRTPTILPLSATAKTGLVDWTSIQIVPDPQVVIAPTEIGINCLDSQKYLNSYFDHFHDRWPIVHRPSVEEEVSETDICELSMRMIGGWLLGTTESIQFAVETHLILVDHLISQLSQFTSHDRFQQSLPPWMCNAALLNIIFGLYYGRDREVSRAIILWNLLTAVLRDVDFFKPETAWPDEKAGYFVPMRLVKNGQRQRLAYNLFKLNAYVSILQNQPMSMFAEELHFSLPCTFALWNCNGLHIWEERQVGEPLYRASKSMYCLIADDAVETTSSQEQPMTIEDIHLCLCAMQADIWKHLQTGISQTNCEANDVLQRDSLRRRLDRLNSRLDRIIAQQAHASRNHFGHEPYLPYSHYFGYENQTQPGWQDVVTTRVKTILFSTIMLYFLLSLHLSVDIRKLTQTAKDRRLSAIEELSEPHRRAREQRQTSMKGWAVTPAARWALCQSVDVLVAYQNFKKGLDFPNVRNLDPICHVALCVSALVAWAFCQYYDHGCELCVPGGNMPIVELTKWSMRGNQFMKEKEEWLETGDRCPRCRPQVQGIQLCRCNTEFATALFESCLPQAWGRAELIAPGIWRGSV